MSKLLTFPGCGNDLPKMIASIQLFLIAEKFNSLKIFESGHKDTIHLCRKHWWNLQRVDSG